MRMNEFQEIGMAGSLAVRRVIAIGKYDSAPILPLGLLPG